MGDATATATARCAHFGECGGCESQDVTYAEQLARKQAALEELFAEHWDEGIPVHASPVQWHYRNKVDFSFALKRYPEAPPKDFKRETVLGFNRKGKWYWPLDIGACHIALEGVETLLQAVRVWISEQGLRAFDSRSKEGFLRALLIRDGKRTGERMVVLVTGPGDFDGASFVACVQDAFPSQSIYRGIFYGLSQGSFADELELLDGEPVIEERLEVGAAGEKRSLRFHISPMSFFQTNSLGTELLYSEVRRWVQSAKPKIVYDLYGGSGGIAFSCSDCTEVLRSVDNVKSATMDGETNKALNDASNVFFTTEKVKNYLLHVVESGGMEPNSVAIVDPPRAGMHPKALRRLVECKPERILYVSCKPSVFAQELPVLAQGYTLEALSAIDLFPHTRHVELIAALKRK